MTDVTIHIGGASVTGQLKELLAGRPIIRSSAEDRYTVRVAISLTGADACDQITALKSAAGIEAGPMTNRQALLLLLGLVDAELHSLSADAYAALHGCEESAENARRHGDLAQALNLIKEMLVDDQD